VVQKLSIFTPKAHLCPNPRRLSHFAWQSVEGSDPQASCWKKNRKSQNLPLEWYVAVNTGLALSCSLWWGWHSLLLLWYFTVSIPLTNGDTWYKKLKEAIEKSQMERIWMSETKVYMSYNNVLHTAVLLLWQRVHGSTAAIHLVVGHITG